MDYKRMFNDKKIHMNLNIIEEFKNNFKKQLKCNEFILDQIFECVKDLYLYFEDDIDIIPKEDDPYNYYIFAGNQKGYSLLEFLLNRVVQNIEEIHYNIYTSNSYDLYHKLLEINEDRYEKIKGRYSKKTIEMFLKKSIYHETIHAIQSNPISIGDKNEFIITPNSFSEVEQKQAFYKKLKIYSQLGIKTNSVTFEELMNIGGHINPRNCSESINEYRAINEALVETLANELSGLRKYVEMLNMDEKVLFYELSRDGQLALLLSNNENGYKYNSHFTRLLLNLTGRKNFFFELFTQRNDMFLNLKERGLIGEKFEESLNADFISTEKNNNVDNYFEILNKYFYLYEESDLDNIENWLPLVVNNDIKSNKR